MEPHKNKSSSSKKRFPLFRSRLRTDYKVKAPLYVDVICGVICLLVAVIIWVAAT